jgi:hypothetical protein
MQHDHIKIASVLSKPRRKTTIVAIGPAPAAQADKGKREIALSDLCFVLEGNSGYFVPVSNQHLGDAQQGFDGAAGFLIGTRYHVQQFHLLLPCKAVDD